ncbi:hypothetical protein BDM02DRAFT_3156207 [Thelephora ganbajun]|uniref:Uncharacterized protein n=1 Tax=Thelephora ganbajun TaxID=370292 RepID=A0ACB6ZCV3_THEGA|nr:hypothetical protein BDM02DRAFT_3156207 [Thelephora ganbajun]
MSSKKVTAIDIPSDTNPQEYEDEHVHAVYEQIASHFSSTRYKPWPIIAKFLSSIPPGYIGLDSGTGNGKYLPSPGPSSPMIGLDRSRNLLQIARYAGSQSTVDSSSAPTTINEVVQADVLNECWRAGVFDYAISIATMHHLTTNERRKTAVQRLIQAVSPVHGRALIYVWAIEQDEFSKRAIPDRGPARGIAGRDVFIPWVLAIQKRKGRGHTTKKDHDTVEATMETESTEEPSKVFNRYYHMFSNGELHELTTTAAQELGLAIGNESGASADQGVEIVQCGWESSNYYIEIRRWQR